jgi:hypothetical protein
MERTMRTTVTLEPDIQSHLKEMSARTGKPFKRVLNEALRAGLKAQRQTRHNKAPAWPVYDMGVPLVDLTKAMALADELDDQRRR